MLGRSRLWGSKGVLEDTEARVALATDFSGSPFLTRAPTVGAFRSRLVMGMPGGK